MGFYGEQRYFSGISDYLSPCIGMDGQWGSAGGLALRESLSLGSLDSVMDVLNSMDAQALAGSLREAGFVVLPGTLEQGHKAVLTSVQYELIAAIDARVDGFGLAQARASRTLLTGAGKQAFAAKVIQPKAALNFTASEFIGDHEAAKTIQGVLGSSAVSVDLLGQALPGARSSLVFVAGQALQKGLQGFGFDGICGKYEVPLSMSEVLGLHRDAARSVAEESARSALGTWVVGDKVTDVSQWVPDSVQRLLQGSLSLVAATAVVEAIQGGAIGQHAGEFGKHEFTRMLTEQGLDVNAKTVARQAEELGLGIFEADRNRGQYVGPIVGLDHRAGLIKFNRKHVIELPFAALAEGQAKPEMGDMVRMGFSKGHLQVNVAQRVSREVVER